MFFKTYGELKSKRKKERETNEAMYVSGSTYLFGDRYHGASFHLWSGGGTAPPMRWTVPEDQHCCQWVGWLEAASLRGAEWAARADHVHVTNAGPGVVAAVKNETQILNLFREMGVVWLILYIKPNRSDQPIHPINPCINSHKHLGILKMSICLDATQSVNFRLN